MAFTFRSSEVWLLGKAIVILDCINRSNMFWMREDNSSLLHAHQALPEPHCSVLSILRRLGKTKGFSEKDTLDSEGSQNHANGKTAEGTRLAKPEKAGTHSLMTVME